MCMMLAPSAIRKLVSPWRVVGPTSARRWTTLLRWCTAITEGRLFRCVRFAQTRLSMRKVAERAAATIATYALPSPDPPQLDALVFFGAPRAP